MSPTLFLALRRWSCTDGSCFHKGGGSSPASRCAMGFRGHITKGAYICRQTDTQTDGQTHGHILTNLQTDRQTDTERQADSQRKEEVCTNAQV